MNTLAYIKQFLYNIRYWLIIGPTVASIIVYFLVRHEPETYSAKTQIYTGIISGETPMEGMNGAPTSWFVLNNTLENLTSIIASYNTLENVSLRLLSQHLVKGNPNKDTDYIREKNFHKILDVIPQDVLDLVDETSEENTYKKLAEYKHANTYNFLYRLFHSNNPYYSYTALSKIDAKRVGTSDILEVKYTSDDPGITIFTLAMLNDEFIDQYENLRYGQANSAIEFFQAEIDKYERNLKQAEDSLVIYNSSNNIINYEEQTKSMISLNQEAELRAEETRLRYNQARVTVRNLEKQISDQAVNLRANNDFLNQMNEVSKLSGQITRMELFDGDNANNGIQSLKSQLEKAEQGLKQMSDNTYGRKYTTEGVPVSKLVDLWLDESLLLEKSRAEIAVINQYKDDLKRQYSRMLPVGIAIKQKERAINTSEQSYLTLLNGLNNAQLQQKSLLLAKAGLKVITPPSYIETIHFKKGAVVMVTFFACAIFIISFFLLFEFLDRRLLDKLHAERLTSYPVIGAYPIDSSKAASQYLGNLVLSKLKPNECNIINIMSMTEGAGKTFIREQLQEYLAITEFSIKHYSWNNNMSYLSKQYLMAENIYDLDPSVTEDIVIIEHPPLREFNMSAGLLEKGCFNFLVAGATYKWTTVDKGLLDSTAAKGNNVPIFIYLNEVKDRVFNSFINS